HAGQNRAQLVLPENRVLVEAENLHRRNVSQRGLAIRLGGSRPERFDAAFVHERVVHEARIRSGFQLAEFLSLAGLRIPRLIDLLLELILVDAAPEDTSALRCA